MSNSQNGRCDEARNRLIKILSHPKVWPTYSLDGKSVELASRFVDRYIYDNKYRVFMPDDGDPMAIIVEKKTLWLAEAHVAACPECRGKKIREFSKSVKDALLRDGIEKVIGMPLASNVAACLFMDDIGFKYVASMVGKKKHHVIELWELDL